MKFPFIEDPKTGKPDVMITLMVIVTLAATLRFFLDGMSFDILGHNYLFSKMDSSTYLALLSPVLGVHGYIKGKGVDDVDTK